MFTEGIKIIDAHAHPILNEKYAKDFPFWSAFSEGFQSGASRFNVENTVFYQRSVIELCDFFGCAEGELAAEKNKLNAGELFSKYITAAGIEAVYLDDGFLKEGSRGIKWHSKFVRTKHILRIETAAEELIEKNLAFSDFIDAFKDGLKKNAGRIAAFKSVLAYRGGLEYKKAALKDAKSEYGPVRGKKIRLSARSLLCFLLEIAMLAAADAGTAFQFHTGFGDCDLEIHKANPVCLSNIFNDPIFSKLNIVLLHAGYPYHKEAAWLASVYPNVYIDLGLAVPSLSNAGIQETLCGITNLCPFNRIIYSSDAHFIPELYYLGAISARQNLDAFIKRLVSGREMSIKFAHKAASMILRENALSIYENK